MDKCYNFLIEQTSIGKGYVYASSAEEAVTKIKNGDYGDIYDTVDTQNGDIIELWEDGGIKIDDSNILLKFWEKQL